MTQHVKVAVRWFLETRAQNFEDEWCVEDVVDVAAAVMLQVEVCRWLGFVVGSCYELGDRVRCLKDRFGNALILLDTSYDFERRSCFKAEHINLVRETTEMELRPLQTFYSALTRLLRVVTPAHDCEVGFVTEA